MSPNEGKGAVIIGFGGRVEFRWNLNEAVFGRLSSKQGCVGVKCRLAGHVDAGSCFPGDRKSKVDWQHCPDAPLWSSVPGLESKVAARWQSDFDASSTFILYCCNFQQQFLLAYDFRLWNSSVSKKAVVTQRRELSRYFVHRPGEKNIVSYLQLASSVYLILPNMREGRPDFSWPS